MSDPLVYPDAPLCHALPSVFTYASHIVWRPPDLTRQPSAVPFRTCGYCGSMHPGDLYDALDAGATLHGSDWKYGWPHKFYVEGIPNPLAGRTVQVGSESYTVLRCPACDARRQPGHDCACGSEAPPIVVERVTRPLLGPAPPHAYAKFYSDHLRDLTDPATFAAVSHRIARASQVEFQLTGDGRLRYRAPHHGFQA